MSKSELEPRVCKFCGKVFQPTHYNQKLCKGSHFRTCCICGKSFNIDDRPYLMWMKEVTCSKECAQEKRRRTSKAKYGYDYPNQAPTVKKKTEETTLKHWGVRHPSQNSELHKKNVQSYIDHYGKDTDGYKELQARKKKTCQSRYGVDCVTQSEAFKQKAEETNLSKYGVRNVLSSSEIQEKIKQTNLDKYGVPIPSMSPEIQEKIKVTNMRRYGVAYVFESPEIRNRISHTIQTKYGVPWYVMTNDCKRANGHIRSRYNSNFLEYAEDQFNIDLDTEFILENKSFDFKYKNYLIELDPTWTHNCIFNPYDHEFSGLPSRYHLDKSQVAWNHQYQCIHIFDWESWYKCLSVITTHHKIYARKCTITTNKDQISQFIVNNHIQNNCRFEIGYGLVYDDSIVCAMTFGKPRYSRYYDYELLRFCNRSDVSVVGGASRLWYEFVHDYNPNSIISYCDKSKFSGDLYTQLGMELDHDSDPNMIWSKNKLHITNNLLLARGYDQLFGTNYGKGTSNRELMIDNGWLPVYDCGQHVYTWRK